MNRTHSAIVATCLAVTLVITWVAAAAVAGVDHSLATNPTGVLATCQDNDGVTGQTTYPCVWDRGPAAAPPRYLVYHRGPQGCPVPISRDVACLPVAD